MALELDDSPITHSADEETGGWARVRIKGSKLGWQTQVEVNGMAIPCTALSYEVNTHGLPSLTLTFPAVVEIDATMEAGQVVVKQSLFAKPQ